MKRNRLFITLILCCATALMSGQQVGDTISHPGPGAALPSSSVTPEGAEAAALAYRNQRYDESIVLYEKIIAQAMSEQKVSAQLYYNLANAYFRNNQIGKAILNYERALLLDPGDGDIRHNLRFARNYTVDRINTASNLFLANWFDGVKNLFSSNQWALFSIVLFILFLACVVVYLFMRLLWARKSAFYTGIVLLLLTISATIFSFSQKNERIHRDKAIVMAGAAAVNSSPDANSNRLFELREGTKVKIRNSDGNWFEIEIADGSVGWVRQKDVEVI